MWQSELSDGIAMLVAGNDRVQAVITQMEEVCQTIEVSLGLEGGKFLGSERWVTSSGKGSGSRLDLSLSSTPHERCDFDPVTYLLCALVLFLTT